MGLFHKESREEKAERLAHERQVKRVKLKAKREAELEAAKRDGKAEGLKGKRTFTDRINATLQEAGKQINNLENIIGEPPHMTIMDKTMPQQTIAIPKKRSKPKQMVVEEKKEKPKTLWEQMMEI